MSHSEIISLDAATSAKPKTVTFENGILQSSNNTNLQYKSYLNTKTNNTVLAVSTNRLVYSGEENSNNDLFNTALLIRNKKHNKIRLVPINTVSFNVQLSKNNSILDTTLSNTILNVRSLYKEFGSKKTKRQTEQIEKMKMNVSNVEDELKEVVADISISQEDLIVPTINENELEYRPKMNRNASNVEDVYDLKTILLQSELDSLKELAIQVRDKHTIAEQLTPFALESVNILQNVSSNNLENYQILLYIDAVLKFFKLPAYSVSKKKLTIGPYPEIIVNKILKEFTIFGNNHRNRPIAMRDKAVCFVIVLALIALNYKLDLTSLSISINVGIKKLLDISRSLGATALSNKNKNTIVLKLPLASSVNSAFQNKRKK